LFSLFFALTVVLAIFGLVIASIFKVYPQSVLPVWISLPIAVVAGLLVRRGKVSLLPLSMLALALIYGSVWLGAYHLPITLPVDNPIIVWTAILLIYCAVASVLPVWLLLQPRDYINSHSCSSRSLAELSADSIVWSAAEPAANKLLAKLTRRQSDTVRCCLKRHWPWSSFLLVVLVLEWESLILKQESPSSTVKTSHWLEARHGTRTTTQPRPGKSSAWPKKLELSLMAVQTF
jgi:hypothetical protein